MSEFEINPEVDEEEELKLEQEEQGSEDVPEAEIDEEEELPLDDSEETGIQTAEESRIYDAPEVEDVAKRLIGNHLGSLAQLKITYLFNENKWTCKGRIMTGAVRKVTGLWKYLTRAITDGGLDVVVIINKNAWDNADANQKNAMVFRQLNQIELNDKDAVVLVDPYLNIQKEVRLYGAWEDSLRGVLRGLEDRNQTALSFPAEQAKEEEPEKPEEASERPPLALAK